MEGVPGPAALEKAGVHTNIGFNSAPHGIVRLVLLKCRCCCVNQRLTKAADPDREKQRRLCWRALEHRTV
ncbi:hypothetical protein AGR1B_Cc130127 [Agrobacterium fabacearum S56]|nr:hypothetical protein AGR1B_Cc130127 [Agrobacterium fabacearum S56]